MSGASTRPDVGDHARPTVDRMEPGDASRMLALLRGVPATVSRADVIDAVLDHGSVDEATRALIAPSLFAPAPVDLEAAEADVASWRARGIDVVAFSDAAYPSALRTVTEAPPLLFVRGTCRAVEPAVAVVGTRRATDQAKAWATEVATELSVRGVTVVSGGAAGVDAAAHRAVLAAGGRTVAVLGTGVDRCYPPEHDDLQTTIAERGLLVSEFWPGTGPTKRSFPRRNAVMSGYAAATVVVEAGERSGTRVQARVAIAQGRRVLLARGVAESTSWGAVLARHAAVHVVDSVDDAVDKLGELLRSQADSYAELNDDLTV